MLSAKQVVVFLVCNGKLTVCYIIMAGIVHMLLTTSKQDNTLLSRYINNLEFWFGMLSDLHRMIMC